MIKKITRKNLIQHFTLLVGVSLLSSCAVLQEDFSCSTISGKPGCHSLREVSQSLKQGQFSENTDMTADTHKPKPPSQLGYPAKTPKAGDPIRFGDYIQKVTVFPYEDSEGHYHDISQIFMVVKNSHWVGQPFGAKHG